MTTKLHVAAAVLAVFTIASNARGDILAIGAAVPITSVDPHFHNLTPNIAASKHVFDTLVLQDASQRLMPGLALSWKAVAPTTWEIKLRAGVKWHDGSPLKAEDIAFTLTACDAFGPAVH
jgi:peptide/nickel transport system substrate-binding protein